ncbi:hypothetical protein EV1_012510 [Malus domestica]
MVNNISSKEAILLTVRLLEPGSGTATAELLGLAAPGVSHQESPVVPDQDVLDLLLALLVHVLLVKRHQGLGNALTDRVDLGGVASAFHSDPHVHAGEALSSEQQDRLVGLESEDLRLHELDWAAVDLDQAASALAVGHCHRRLLPPEALYGLDCWGRHGWFSGVWVSSFRAFEGLYVFLRAMSMEARGGVWEMLYERGFRVEGGLDG